VQVKPSPIGVIKGKREKHCFIVYDMLYIVIVGVECTHLSHTSLKMLYKLNQDTYNLFSLETLVPPMF
jgi:hypothetical protein